MEKEQKMYELAYLLNPLIAEEKIDEEVLALRKAIEDHKGLIMSESRPKIQKLAYEIKKPTKGNFDTAYFGLVKFLFAPELVLEIKKDIKKLEIGGNKILRSSLVKVGAETIASKPVKRIIRKKKPVTEVKEKSGIKIEEIDKKIEELIGHEV